MIGRAEWSGMVRNGRLNPIEAGDWLYLTRGKGKSGPEFGELRGLRRSYQGSLDGSGDTDKFGEGVAAGVGCPEVAACVDSDGVGLNQNRLTTSEQTWRQEAKPLAEATEPGRETREGGTGDL